MSRVAVHHFDSYDLVREIAAMYPSPDSPIGEMARGLLARREAETQAPKERNDDEHPRS